MQDVSGWPSPAVGGPLAPAVGDICLFQLSSEQRRCNGPQHPAVSTVLSRHQMTLLPLPGTQDPSPVAIYNPPVGSATGKTTQNSTKFLPISPSLGKRKGSLHAEQDSFIKNTCNIRSAFIVQHGWGPRGAPEGHRHYGARHVIRGQGR